MPFTSAVTLFAAVHRATIGALPIEERANLCSPPRRHQSALLVVPHFAAQPTAARSKADRSAVWQRIRSAAGEWISNRTTICGASVFTADPALNGVMVTIFEPLLGADRSGSEPDRFKPQMQEAGLDTERSDPQHDTPRLSRAEQFDPIIAVLNMLTHARGRS